MRYALVRDFFDPRDRVSSQSPRVRGSCHPVYIVKHHFEDKTCCECANSHFNEVRTFENLAACCLTYSYICHMTYFSGSQLAKMKKSIPDLSLR